VTTSLSYLLSAFVATVTIGLSHQCAQRGQGKELVDLEISLFLLMMFLVAPLSWEHHLVYVLPPALMAIQLLLVERLHRNYLVILLLALFVVAWEFPRDEMFFLKGATAALIPIKFYAVFAIWVFFAVKVWKRLGGQFVVTTRGKGWLKFS
jgi:hypothetical protein